MIDDPVVIKLNRAKVLGSYDTPIEYPIILEQGSRNILTETLMESCGYLEACVDLGIISEATRDMIVAECHVKIKAVSESGVLEERVTALSIPKIHLTESFQRDNPINYHGRVLRCHITTPSKSQAEQEAEISQKSLPDHHVVIAVIPSYALFWE